MEMTRKQAEFWSLIIAMMIAVAIIILLIDFGIKAAILEESNKLRLVIEKERSGQKPGSANANGAANDTPNNPPLPSDVLVVDPPRMETRNGHTGSQKPPARARNRRNEPS